MPIKAKIKIKVNINNIRLKNEGKDFLVTFAIFTAKLLYLIIL